MEESKWTTTFQVSIPDILQPEKFKQGRKKFLDRLTREIEPIRKELGFPVDGTKEDQLVWQINNKQRVESRMREACSSLWLPDSDDFVLLMTRIFFDDVKGDTVPLLDSVFTPLIKDAAPLFFMSVAIPPDINKLEPEDRERFLANGLFVEGMIPGLSKESFFQIFKHRGDFLIRGNLALFNADAFREIGKWLDELKHQIGGQDVFKIKPGRVPGPSPKNEEMALEVYETYLAVKSTYQNKPRKQRSHNSSRYRSIYDEVGRNYEGKHKLEIGSLSDNRVKYLIRKGKRISDVKKGGNNPA